MKEIYKENDIVYHHEFGKGIVKQVDFMFKYGVFVEFLLNNKRVYFTDDGKVSDFDKNPSLSFAPYDFINGGFSQKRPLPEIEKNTLVYVKFYTHSMWEMRYFSHFDSYGAMFVFDNQKKSDTTNLTLFVTEWSLTNPL